MRAVNLLPKDSAGSGGFKLTTPIVLAAAAPILAGCLVFVGYTFEHSKVSGKQGQLTAVQAQVASLPKHHAADPSAATVIAERTSRLAAFDSVLEQRLPWDVSLLDLAHVLPVGVTVRTLGVVSPTPADATAAPTSTNPNAFTLTGTALSQVTVGELMERLQLLPMLSQVTLVSTTSSTGATSAAGTGATSPAGTVQSSVDFSITAAINPPATGATT